MYKKKLRELRKLNATREMVEKAKSDKPTKGKRGWNYEITFPHKYGLYLRAQHLAGILKIAVYPADWMVEGIITPCYEIYIDYDNSQFITRRLDKHYNEVKWTEAMIDNLNTVEGVKLGRYYGACIVGCCAEDPWMDAHQASYIKKTLKTDSSGYRAIVEYQRRVRKQNIEAARKRETAPWDADMERVPDEPKMFRRWVEHEATPINYMIYDYDRKGATKAWCTYCERQVNIKDKPLHNNTGTCPRCHKSMTYKSSGKIKTLSTGWYDAQLVQNIDGGVVVRYFGANKTWHGNTKASLHVHESMRCIIMDGTVWEYNWELYKNTEHRWCLNKYRSTYGNYSGYIYPCNMYHLRKTGLIHSSLPDMVRHDPRKKIDACRWIEMEHKEPNIERCVKAGLYTLAAEIAYDTYHIKLNRSSTELTKALGIDRMRLARLVAHDGGYIYLEYLQLEKAKNTIYPDDMIIDLTENNITVQNLKKITTHMSLQKAYNYLKKNSESNVYRPLAQALTTYADYYHMAEELKMDISSEQIYKPKDLKKAHQQVIDMLNRKGWEKTAEKSAKKFPKVNKELLRLTKYEYKGTDYQIVAPKTITDIVREGSILGHCIHTCDFYYSRIETRESFIMFLRKNEDPDKPWYTLEVEPSGNIRQKRTVGDNQNDDLKAAVPFLHEWQRWLQKVLNKEDRKLAKISEKKRRENYKKIRDEQKRVWHGKLQGKLLADVLEADFLGLEDIDFSNPEDTPNGCSEERRKAI